MIHHINSQFNLLIPDRLIRNTVYFLLSLGCAIGGHFLITHLEFSEALNFLNLNGGFFGLFQSGSAQRLELTPSVVGCFFMLIMVILFLLQPLSSINRSSNKSLKQAFQRSVQQSSSSLKRSIIRRSTFDLDIFPMIDWVVISEDSIATGTSQDPMEAPSDLRFRVRDVQQLSALLSRSLSDVVVLAGSAMTLKSLEVALGIERLQREGLEVVTAISARSSQDYSSGEPLSSYPALYDFLSDSLGVRQVDHRVRVSRSQDSACYIVRREVLLSMLNLWEWSVMDAREFACEPANELTSEPMPIEPPLVGKSLLVNC